MRLIKLSFYDLLERLRQYRFVAALIAVFLLSYSISTQEFTFHYGYYVSESSGAWLGLNFSIFQALFFSLAGFYLVNGNIAHDRHTRVLALFNSSATKDRSYLLSKALSNLGYLLLLHLVFLLLSIIIHYLQSGENGTDFSALMLSQCVIIIPIIISVSGIALLFSSHRILAGIVGNVLYFVIWITLVNLSNQATGPGDPDILGFTFFKSDFLAFVQSQAGAVDGFWDVAFKTNEYTALSWPGVNWTSDSILGRVWYLAPGIVSYFASVWMIRIARHTREKAPQSQNRLLRFHILLSDRMRALLSRGRVANLLLNIRFLRPLMVEGNFLSRNLSIYFLLLIIWVNLWTLFSASNYDLRYTSFAWIIFAPIALWSKLGIYEAHFKTAPVLYSASRGIAKHTLIQYLSAVMISTVFSFGLVVKAIYLQEYALLMVLFTSLFFFPALSFLLGAIAKTQKLFEVLFLVIWYIGPLRVHPYFDQLFQLPGRELLQISLILIVLGGLCLMMAMVSRSIQLKTG